uniref:RING-type domain-containing protein n=1 Tax=Oryza meridionalis TaxID=40149 RepID=A0A0E0D1E5_9ORYZ
MCRRHVTPPPIADEDDDDDSESDDDDDDDDPVLLFTMDDDGGAGRDGILAFAHQLARQAAFLLQASNVLLASLLQSTSRGGGGADILSFANQLARQAGAFLQDSNDILASLLQSTSRGAAAGAAAASDEAIQALKDVGGGDVDGGGQKLDCAICLNHDDPSASAAAGWKEMPCGHRFHGGCLEKWLRMHGTCPMCRHQMPAAEVVEGAASEVTTSESLLLIARVRRSGDGGNEEEHYHYNLYEIRVQYSTNVEINP